MNGNEGRTRGGFPFGLLVSVVAAGGVEGWNADLSAGVAFDGGFIGGIEWRWCWPQAKLAPHGRR